MAMTYMERLPEDMEDDETWLMNRAHHKVFGCGLLADNRANHVFLSSG